MPTDLIMKLAGYAIAVAGVLGSLYAGYTHVKGIGYAEAETKYELVIKDYEEQRDAKIKKIEELSTLLVGTTKSNNDATAKDVKSILALVKTKPLTLVKDGECSPSTAFSDSIFTINKRVNQSILESQK